MGAYTMCSSTHNFQYAVYYNQVMANPQLLAQVQQWFRAIDRDGSGQVSANELSGIQFNGRPIGNLCL